MKYFKKLVGEQVYLSPVNPEDVERYTEWLNNLSTTVKLGMSREVFGLRREQEILNDMAKEGHHFAIVSLQTNELLGNCSLFSIHPVHRTAEVGIFIGEEAARGQGFGTEALQLVCEYGFQLLNLQNIMLRFFEFNKPALRSYEKAGFRIIGRRTQSYYVNGHYFDEIFMEMLPKDLTAYHLSDTLPVKP
ncbi:GNAT family N-acetyltransferase [Paenibacillus sanguinis]|uniref:GNAT family N-acetyltransferase n=1 Tax=Paenibacillus sanguinis TaxID=225906 RepID=UPI00036D67D0|nr:GNAT family protein [Paenibacillus sanguinis]